MSELLEVKNLSVSFDTPRGKVHAVRDVSFSLKQGEVLAIVGESGCGKSVLCKSIMKLLPRTAKVESGSILIEGKDITHYREREMRKLRGKLFSMVFQDPMTSLNPTYTIGHQLIEAIMLHTNRNRQQAKERALEMLKLVNVNDPEKRMKQYPYEHSGGMRQRVMIAMALACEPKLLIADEPTTALDVTIQAQILELMQDLRKKDYSYSKRMWC